MFRLMAPPRMRNVLFLGSKPLGLSVLRVIHALEPDRLTAVITLDDSTDSRSALAEFKLFAQEQRLPLHLAKNRKHSEELVRALSPDLCFVVGWYWLFSRDLLARVPGGFIGIHNSLLPKYRGGSPLIWALINGEPRVGFSLFSFAEGMDDGPVWAQGTVAVKEEDCVSDVLNALEAETLAVVKRTYGPILDGTLAPAAQDHNQATYCAQRIPADGNVDWQRPARAVYNFIRAQSEPYPGAFTYCQGQAMKIWKASVYPFPYFGTCGQVARIGDNGVCVVCGNDGALLLEEVELNGERGPAHRLITSVQTRFGRTPEGHGARGGATA